MFVTSFRPRFALSGASAAAFGRQQCRTPPACVPTSSARTGSASAATSGTPSHEAQEPTYYPGIEEETEVLHDAFHRAFEEAKPCNARIPGLQEFAAALWERRRLIPSNHDPLMHIFTEFDTDNDGMLSAADIASALRSRGVTVNAEQVQWLINTYEEERTCILPCFETHAISREEWANFVYSLTVADLHAVEDPSHASTLESPL